MHRFGNEIGGPGFKRLFKSFVFVRCSDHHHLDVGQFRMAFDEPGGLDAIHSRHGNIHEHKVRGLAFPGHGQELFQGVFSSGGNMQV